jgi:hypothetical protein
MDWGHKFTAKAFEQGNVSLSFLWCPTNVDTIIEPLLAMTEPPSHVIFNMGMYLNLFTSAYFLRWIASKDAEGIRKVYWDFLELMKKHFSEVTQHIVLRTTTSVVKVHLISSPLTVC